MTFRSEHYRRDVAELEYRVVAEDDREVRTVEEALNREDADELAVAMNSLERKYRPPKNC